MSCKKTFVFWLKAKINKSDVPGISCENEMVSWWTERRHLLASWGQMWNISCCTLFLGLMSPSSFSSTQFQVVWLQSASVYASCVAQRQSRVGSQSTFCLPPHLPTPAQLPAEQRSSAGAVGTPRWEEMDGLLGFYSLYFSFKTKTKNKNEKHL